MRSSTLRVNSSTSSHLIDLLKRCCDSRVVSPGKQVHQRIIHHGFDKNPFILTKLVQFYADCNCFSYARKLFDELSQPNVFAWTSLLAFHSRNSGFKECLRRYRQMRSTGLSPDNYVFPIVLRACANSESFDLGESIHKDMIVCGAESNLQACNSLINMYSKFGDLQSARRVFDGMDGARDLLSWNSIISGCVSNGFYELAVNSVEAMKSDHVEPDLVTWNSIMDAYCRSGKCEMALQLFTHIKEPSIISWTILVSGFSRIGKHQTSLEIFKEMINSGKVIPDLDSLSTAMTSSRFLQSSNSAREIHAYGIKLHDRRTLYVSIGPALLTAYTRHTRIRDAETLFCLMDGSDVVTWNAMILGFVDLGMENKALEYFARMKLIGVKSDQTTLSILLPVRDLNLGKQVHGYIIRNNDNFDHEVLILNALICMYLRCGCVDSATVLFSKMTAKDLVSYNTMMGGFAIHGRGKEALKLLQEIKSAGHSPDSLTLTSVISACSHSGLVDEGLQVFNSMNREPGFVVKSEHIGGLVDMLSRAGRLDEAIEILKRVPVEQSKQTWGALLAASQAQMNIEGAEVAVENLEKLEPENAGHYVTLANMYAGGGRWEDGVQVRKIMEHKGLVKMMGISRM